VSWYRVGVLRKLKVGCTGIQALVSCVLVPGVRAQEAQSGGTAGSQHKSRSLTVPLWLPWSCGTLPWLSSLSHLIVRPLLRLPCLALPHLQASPPVHACMHADGALAPAFLCLAAAGLCGSPLLPDPWAAAVLSHPPGELTPVRAPTVLLLLSCSCCPPPPPR